jgi:hypothetical protein
MKRERLEVDASVAATMQEKDAPDDIVPVQLDVGTSEEAQANKEDHPPRRMFLLTFPHELSRSDRLGAVLNSSGVYWMAWEGWMQTGPRPTDVPCRSMNIVVFADAAQMSKVVTDIQGVLGRDQQMVISNMVDGVQLTFRPLSSQPAEPQVLPETPIVGRQESQEPQEF